MGDYAADDHSLAQPSPWYFPCYIPSHNWLSTPCECPMKQGRMNQPASYGASNASSSYGDEAGLPFDNLEQLQLLDNLPSSPLTMNGGIFPPPPFGVVPHTPSGYYMSHTEAPPSAMEEDVFSLDLDQECQVSQSSDVQYFDRSQQNAPVQHLTIDTKELWAPPLQPFSPPMAATTSIPIPSLPSHISPGHSSLMMTPSLTSSSYSYPIHSGLSPEGAFSVSTGLSPEVASPPPLFDLRGNPQVPCVDTSYDEQLYQGYPGDSLIAHERREVLRRTIANEMAQVPTCARDIKRLADVQRVTDVILEDDVPSSGKKTAAFVLQCAWIRCNHSCTRPDRLKTHVFTHIQFKPFTCDKSCGDPHCSAKFFSKGDCNSHQMKDKKKKICGNCGEECTGKNWQRHARSNKCKNNGRRTVPFSI